VVEGLTVHGEPSGILLINPLTMTTIFPPVNDENFDAVASNLPTENGVIVMMLTGCCEFNCEAFNLLFRLLFMTNDNGTVDVIVARFDVLYKF